MQLNKNKSTTHKTEYHFDKNFEMRSQHTRKSMFLSIPTSCCNKEFYVAQHRSYFYQFKTSNFLTITYKSLETKRSQTLFMKPQIKKNIP